MAVQNSTLTEQERARLAQQPPGLARIATGVRDAAIGVVARPVTSLHDAARVSATRWLGGDPTTLVGGPDRYNAAAQQLTDRGVGDIRMGLSEVVNPIRQAGLDALGAQPMQSAAPTQPVQAAPPPTVSPIQAQPNSQPAGAQARTAADLAGINEGLAYTVDSSRTPTPRAPERGNYNTANTSKVDAQGNVTSTIGENSANPVSFVGGFGGFAPGDARAYLDRMRVQDAQEQARADERRRAAQDGVERIGLRNTAAGGSVQESMVARRQLASMDQSDLQRMQEQGATERQDMQGVAELQRAGLAGALGLQQEAMRAEAGLAEAELTGRFGLAGREATAQGRILTEQLKGNSGAELKAQAEAMRLIRQQALAAEYEAAGDFAGRDRALGISQPGSPRLTQDALGNVIALDGRPVTAAEAEAYRQSIGFYKTPGQ